jgi:hypothetical protein
MRRFVKWIGGAVGGIAAYRFVRRQEAALQPTAEADARADELRAKLAESRAAEPVAEPMPEEDSEPAAEPESPEERRRRVHEEGRSALDEMRPE